MFDYGSWIVVILFFVMQMFSFTSFHDPWWDSSVYMNMGKYIFSGGEVGVWEPSRPLVWSAVLGAGWFLGFDQILYGRIVNLILSVGSVVLVYLISRRLGGERVGFLTTLFFAFSPTFFLFSQILFSEIVSLFLVLLGLYFFLRERYSLSGLFFGIACMSRFFVGFFILGFVGFYFLATLFDSRRRGNLRKWLYDALTFGVPFLLPAVCFLVLNMFLYGDMFFPFTLQAFMTKYTGWIFHHDVWFYIIGLFHENIFSALFLVGGAFMLFHGRLFEKSLAFGTCVALVLFFHEPHKEMRFMIGLLPVLWYGVSRVIDSVVSFARGYEIVVLSGFVFVWLLGIGSGLYYDAYEDGLDAFYSFASGIDDTKRVWISNPSFVVHTDVLASELIYYPLYGSDRARQLRERVDFADVVMLNTCDILPCRADDLMCGTETDALFSLFEETMRLEYVAYEKGCEHYIFVR